ncbi:MAG: PfkB family carbohydrate kinase [Elusimicrobiota bacterium]
MNPILVVGSVALDSVQTPEGESTEALGGSAVYFSLAARHFASVSMVGVVGTDFPARHREMLVKRGVDVSGLKEVPGKTFRWVGKFGGDMNKAETLDTQLNVFETFDPRLTDVQKGCPVVFLANIDPDLQRGVLDQMQAPKLVACDTMDFWIGSKKPAIKKLLSRVDVLFINDEEARELSGRRNNVLAARRLSEWGPGVVVVKKGEHGALLLAQGRVFPFPAYPLDEVKDPTGAGDSFAGGFMGAMSSAPESRDVGALKRALVCGIAVSSLNVGAFGTRRLEELDAAAIEARCRSYLELLDVSFSGIAAVA